VHAGVNVTVGRGSPGARRRLRTGEGDTGVGDDTADQGKTAAASRSRAEGAATMRALVRALPERTIIADRDAISP